MRNLCALVCFLMLTQPLHAACSGERHGQTSAAIFEISDGGCEYAEAMIQVRRFDEVGGTSMKPDLVAPFARDCRDTTFGFTCGLRKGNPLSGVAYRRTQDTNPSCPGEERGERLTCFKGCTSEVPRYFYVSPYEC